jgi:hypothetical protein
MATTEVPIEEQENCPICYETFHLVPVLSDCSDDDEEEEQQRRQQQRLQTKRSMIDTGALLSRHHPQERMKVPECGHQFCRDCLTNHCQYSISVQKVPIHCPGNQTSTDVSERCKSVLPFKQVQNLLLVSSGIEQQQPPPAAAASSTSSTTTTTSTTSPQQNTPTTNDYQYWFCKFQRLYQMSQDKSLLLCTRCQELVLTHQDNNRNNINNVSCHTCGHIFCPVHGDGHLGLNCKDYSQQIQKQQQDHVVSWQMKESERIIQKYCKPCSHCQAQIFKESGCDHIVCPSCHHDMCFRCGTHQYLQGKENTMIRNCQQCQQSFIDHRYMGWYRLLICITLPFYLPLFILHVVVVGAIAVASCGCCCCLGCGIQPGKDDSSITNTPPTVERRKQLSNIKWRPQLAVQTVFAMVFLPFVNLFHQCGIPCCTCCSLDHDDDHDDENDSHSNGNCSLNIGLANPHHVFDSNYEEQQQHQIITKSTSLASIDKPEDEESK